MRYNISLIHHTIYFFLIKYVLYPIKNISLYILIFLIIGCGYNTKEKTMSYITESINKNDNYPELNKYVKIDKIIDGYSLTKQWWLLDKIANLLKLKSTSIKYSLPKTIVKLIKKYIIDEIAIKALICSSDIEKIDDLSYELLQSINFKERYLKDIFAKSTLYHKSKTYKYILQNTSLELTSTYLEPISFKKYRDQVIQNYMKNELNYSNYLIQFIKSIKELENYAIKKGINQYVEGKTLLRYASEVCNVEVYEELRKLGANPLLFTEEENLTVLDLACRFKERVDQIEKFIKFLNQYETPNTKKLIGVQSNKNRYNALYYYLTSGVCYTDIFFLIVKNFHCDPYKKYKEHSLLWHLIQMGDVFNQSILFKYIKLIIEECDYDIIEDLYDALVKSKKLSPSENNIFKNNRWGPSNIEIMPYLDNMKSKKNLKFEMDKLIKAKRYQQIKIVLLLVLLILPLSLFYRFFL